MWHWMLLSYWTCKAGNHLWEIPFPRPLTPHERDARAKLRDYVIYWRGQVITKLANTPDDAIH